MILKFISLRDISLGVKFEKIESDDIFDGQSVYDFEIYSATPFFGYDKNGKILENENFVLLGFGGAQVEDTDEATMLASGRIFTSYINDSINFTVVPNDVAFFRKEFKAFAEFINNGLEDLYKEIDES